MMHSLLGVYGAPHPAEALRNAGEEPVWHNEHVALGGSDVFVDDSSGTVVGGKVHLHNAATLRRELSLPEATHAELLAALYTAHGECAGKHGVGMYGVAIWDERGQRLMLLRDGVGARIIYFARFGNVWWFSDRLRTLHEAFPGSGKISLSALRKYLTFSFVPGRETLWQDILELRQGTTLTLPVEKYHRYWYPEEGSWDSTQGMEVYAMRLREQLEEAVHCRVPEGEPVGVFLSGGLDSSIAAALTAKYATADVHTYSLHFGDEYPDELEYSELVAKQLQTQHHVLEVTPKQIREHLGETIATLDDPIGDPLTVPNWLLCQAAAKDVNVILNGEGGDPCFGGPKNQPMLLHTLYGSDESLESAYLRSYRKCYEDLPRLLKPDVQAVLRGAEPLEYVLQPFLTDPPQRHFLNRLMQINIRLKGADHILTKVNNLTSAAGILGQSPLFDRRIVQMSMQIPPEYKLAGNVEKAVLKHAVRDLLPETIVSRPKSGMMVPVQGWFRRDLKRFAGRMLLGRRARIRPYLNQNVIREWLDYRGNVWARHGAKLWLILSLELWLRANE